MERRPNPERIASAALALLLSVSLFANSSPAQTGATFDRVRGIDHSVMYYLMEGGSLWARGAQYKVSFDAAGATYIPVFGKRQPHNVPHALSPDRVTVGGEPLSFERAAPAVRDGDRVEIDRGAFVEAYDLTPQSLEQTFVFSSLPRSGDLVLHIPVSSEFEGVESAAGLEFRGEFGRVVYGRATAIDASGRRQTADTKLENGAITIELDASFLATAALPLVIDPVVSTFVINGWSNSNDYYSDAAYDPTNHVWLVVYEETNSGADSDVFASVLSDVGPTGGGFYVDLSTDSWESVHCANNAAAQQFLMVATVVSPPLLNHIRGSTFYAFNAPGTEFTIAFASNASDIPLFPVVGGDPGGGDTYCVAYARARSSTDWDIEARLVRPDGTLVGSHPIYLSNSSNTIDTSPAISKSNDHNEWMIAWQRNIGTNLADIWGGRIRWDGTVTATPFQISNEIAEERSPSVSSPLFGGPNQFLVAWQLLATPTFHDIIVGLFQGNTLLDKKDLYDLDAVGPDQISPSVDSDGHHFLVSRSDGQGADYDIYATDLYVQGNALGISQHAMPLDVSVDMEDNSRVVSAESSGAWDPSLRHRFLATWNSGPAGGWADIRGGFVDTVDGGERTPFCFGDSSSCPCTPGAAGHGCGNSANSQGALLTASGNSAPNNDSLVLSVSGVPATALCVFFQGTSAISHTVFGDGSRCVAGTLIRLRSVPASGGAVSIPGPSDPPIHTMGAVPSTGGTRYHQVWYRDPANYCLPATYNISNGMIVVWAP